MRLAPTVCSIILLAVLLSVPPMAASPNQTHPDFSSGEPMSTSVSSNQESLGYTNGESVILGISSNGTYPEFFNGCPVIFVETSENTYSLPPGQVILVIYDDSSNTTEGSVESFDHYLCNHRLPEGWSITVLGGPGFSCKEDALQQVLQINASWNKAIEENGGPFVLGPIPSP
jgi:TusA-related sulfurtransferase